MVSTVDTVTRESYLKCIFLIDSSSCIILVHNISDFNSSLGSCPRDFCITN